MFHHLKPVPRILKNLLSRLDVSCQFGCQETVKLDRLEIHESACDFDPKRPVPCSKGCGLVIPKDELKDHDCEMMQQQQQQQQQLQQPQQQRNRTVSNSVRRQRNRISTMQQELGWQTLTNANLRRRMPMRLPLERLEVFDSEMERFDSEMGFDREMQQRQRPRNRIPAVQQESRRQTITNADLGRRMRMPLEGFDREMKLIPLLLLLYLFLLLFFLPEIGNVVSLHTRKLRFYNSGGGPIRQLSNVAETVGGDVVGSLADRWRNVGENSWGKVGGTLAEHWRNVGRTLAERW